MKVMRVFRCECGEVEELLICSSIGQVDCLCGEIMSRQLGTPKYFGNTTGKSPSASSGAG